MMKDTLIWHHLEPQQNHLFTVEEMEIVRLQNNKQLCMVIIILNFYSTPSSWYGFADNGREYR